MRACSGEQVLSFPKGDALQKATFDVLQFNMIASFTFSHFLCLCPQKLVKHSEFKYIDLVYSFVN